MTVKEEVHRLVDELPEDDLFTARRLLRGLTLTRDQQEQDTLVGFLERCPEDDEPTTEEDLAAVERGRDAALRGELVTHDAVIQRSRDSRR